MRVCDVCGTLNFRENNYCIHCGNKFVLEHICPFCGSVNEDYVDFCVKCNKQINPISIDDFDILFSEFNENLLLNAKITDEEYNNLLNNIFLRANYIEIQGNTIKDKILNLASIFTQCKPKARGYERGFLFLGDNIFYDDRLDDSVQIATIIHELAHYLLFNIIESLLCDIFNVETSKTLKSFIWYFLMIPEFKIVNEYCAHTVEGRFIPYGYQNYGSFNLLVKNAPFDEDSINTMIMFGNSFANEIIVYLEEYICDDLRQEIKIQYKLDSGSKSYDSILLETDDCFSLNDKNRMLIKILYDIFKEASNISVREELESIMDGLI
ncbi:MAG: zinc ribbon domain-containing protein [Methanobrevibacter sp.]|uniref:zinc ribbon domain-containing protein n=1 Tax=Methanobrevibacter sp. TaxID=66852 RepID=UPI003F10D4BC